MIPAATRRSMRREHCDEDESPSSHFCTRHPSQPLQTSHAPHIFFFIITVIIIMLPFAPDPAVKARVVQRWRAQRLYQPKSSAISPNLFCRLNRLIPRMEGRAIPGVSGAGVQICAGGGCRADATRATVMSLPSARKVDEASSHPDRETASFHLLV